MKRIVTIASILLLVLMASVEVDRAQTQQPLAPVTKWEYAELLQRHINKTTIYFTSQEVSHDEIFSDSDYGAGAYAKMYRAIGGKGKPIEGDRYIDLDLLNAAGLSGWQLIIHENTSESETWIFKKPM